jgi:heat shock protein HslJ
MKQTPVVVFARTIAIGCAAMVAACSHNEPTPVASGATPSGSDEVIYELTGTRWALAQINGKPVTIEGQQREPYVVLESASTRVVGYAGCNRIAGSYELRDEMLGFGQIRSTRMACPQLATEDALLKALKETRRWRIESDRLDLLDARDAVLASFLARNL